MKSNGNPKGLDTDTDTDSEGKPLINTKLHLRCGKFLRKIRKLDAG